MKKTVIVIIGIPIHVTITGHHWVPSGFFLFSQSWWLRLLAWDKRPEDSTAIIKPTPGIPLSQGLCIGRSLCLGCSWGIFPQPIYLKLHCSPTCSNSLTAPLLLAHGSYYFLTYYIT